ncbi:hypothetical protein OPQ81_006719 [Rhizoctonia solani]|nr:hypothetical protein OPQ81_006719 [Rhizoctonia solani]
MAFHPFDVTTPHLAYTVLGGFVVVFGMFSLLIREKAYIGEAVIATVFGIIIGPYCAGIFDPRGWANSHEVVNEITLEVTRVVLAIGVFAIGVELPKQYMLKHWKSIFMLLVPVMTYGWFISAALIYALIPNLNFLSSLVIAACLTPTDPILAAAVAESGCNDGAAFPFLFIAIYLIIEKSDRVAVGEWFYVTWLYEVALGIAFGAILGYGFRHLMRFCERKDLIDRQSYVAQYVSLALLTIGATTLLGSDDLLAAFACGTAFAWDGWFNRQTEESMFSNVIDLLFNCACFIFIGAWIPFDDFDAPELSISPWRLIVLGLAVVALRRLPIMLALYKFIPDIRTLRECVFAGHFGPMGVGAVFISTLAAIKLPEPMEIHHDGLLANGERPQQIDYLGHSIQPVVAFMVLISIMIHGLSIPFFSLGKRVHSIRHTWSRRDTVEGGRPEWATQVRQVRPGEEIIVNRDDAVERGEMPALDEKRGSVPISELSGEGSSGTSDIREREHGTGEHVTSAEGREGRMSGDQIDDVEITEWREGPHLVIERSTGPGEEVQVEVVKNAYASSGTRSRSNSPSDPGVDSHKISGPQEEVHQQLSEHLHSIGHEAEVIGEKLGITHSHDSSKDKHDQPSSIATPGASGSRQQPSGTPELPSIVLPDEEEEDRSRSQTRGIRHHVRDHLIGRPRAATDRTHGHSRNASAPNNLLRDPAARLRADTVRDTRRDASPARSIRFADDRPRSFAGEGSIPPNGTTNGNGNGESTQRVMFDLPSEKSR